MWDWTRRLDELARGGTPVAIVTIIGCSGSTPRELGAKMLVREDGRINGTIGGGHLEELCIGEARACLASDAARTLRIPLGAKTGQCCGGVVDVLVEVVNVGPTLYLFGVGHVGQALCHVLAATPFRIEVVDPRDGWVNAPEIPPSVIRHACEWDEVTSSLRWDAARTFVAIMTHRHDTDQDIVEHVLDKPAKHIGLIGSATKWQRFRTRLLAKGRTEAELARIKCPIGLDIGGKSPGEVAVSIAAEMLKIHHGK
jgi:xanthine dehydrogenase accessory factor